MSKHRSGQYQEIPSNLKYLTKRHRTQYQEPGYFYPASARYKITTTQGLSVSSRQGSLQVLRSKRCARIKSWNVCHFIPDFPVSSFSKLKTEALVDNVINTKTSAPNNTRSTRNTKEVFSNPRSTYHLEVMYRIDG